MEKPASTLRVLASNFYCNRNESKEKRQLRKELFFGASSQQPPSTGSAQRGKLFER